MKRTLLITAAVLLIAAGPASAGLCIDTDSSCNDVYVEFEPMGVITEAHGYEYGCGAPARLLSGTIHPSGNSYFIGLTGSYGENFDFGQLASLNFVIDSFTLTGGNEYLYTYLSGGLLTGHGGTDGVTAYICSNPGLPLTAFAPDVTNVR